MSKMMKTMITALRQDCAWTVCAFALGLAGCGTTEAGGSAPAETKNADDGLYPVEVSKAHPGAAVDDYLVIDVSGGQAAATWPVTHLDKAPEGGWGDEYKTDKIVLRKVNAGSFLRQPCTAQEAWLGRAENPPVETSVGKAFYIGVFEITQRQYERVTGMRPSHRSSNEGWERLPVTDVSYDDIRGHDDGSQYPESSAVDATSFIGFLREKTGLKGLDLPTVVVWEYCCVAGGAAVDVEGLDRKATFSHYPSVKDPNGVPTEVGSHEPNALGLYDMQGNVHEWCLDAALPDETAVRAFRAFGRSRSVRGGHYEDQPELCHPSIVYGEDAVFSNPILGLRICLY